MRKLYLVLAALLAAHLALLLVHPPGAQQVETGPGLDVGIVFDLGGRGDKSFNDGAFIGAERARKALGARVRFIEPGEGSDREAGLRLLAAEGMELVIGVGFIFSDDLTQLANEYPKVRFAGVDYAVA
ncbi:MAG: BMP family ABC transporter substrate-binding protein, partial [Gemmatimonadota bacterium]